MWDELLTKCEQSKADLERETTRMVVLVDTMKAKPMSVSVPAIASPKLPSWMDRVWYINEFVQRSDRADERAKQLRISAGIALVNLKREFQDTDINKRLPDERTWDAFCDKYLTFHRRRADQLIAFVEGRANEDQVREANRTAMRLLRERERKERLTPASRDADEDDIEAEIDDEPDTRRLAFVLRADQARLFAKYTGPVDDEVLSIAREAMTAWVALVNELTKEMRYGEERN